MADPLLCGEGVMEMFRVACRQAEHACRRTSLQEHVLDELIEFFRMTDDERTLFHIQPAPFGAFTVTLDHPRFYNWPAEFIEGTGVTKGVHFVAPNTHQLCVVPVQEA